MGGFDGQCPLGTQINPDADQVGFAAHFHSYHGKKMTDGGSIFADQIDLEFDAAFRKRAIPASIQLGEVLWAEKFFRLHALGFFTRVACVFFVLGIPSHDLAVSGVNV